MNNKISLTWEEWQEQFKPIPNTINEYRVDTPAFETYGEELDFVEKFVAENKVWTMIDFGNGNVIINGYAWVNRMCYYITEVPWQENTDYEVALYIETCEKCGEPYDFACIEDDGENTCPRCCGHEGCQD